MKLLYRCCAGLDIHRDTVSACVRRRARGQAEALVEEQVFGTFTQELERLRGWLRKHKVRQVAIVDTAVCPKCARWRLPRCICLLKRKCDPSAPLT